MSLELERGSGIAPTPFRIALRLPINSLMPRIENDAEKIRAMGISCPLTLKMR